MKTIILPGIGEMLTKQQMKNVRGGKELPAYYGCYVTISDDDGCGGGSFSFQQCVNATPSNCSECETWFSDNLGDCLDALDCGC